MENEDILNPHELIDRAEAMVIKFGGDNAADFEENLALAQKLIAKGQKFVFVFSAFKDTSEKYRHLALVDPQKGFNTTSHLIKMADAAKAKDFDEAMKYLNAVKTFYVAKVGEKIPAGEIREVMLECVEQEFRKLEAIVKEATTLNRIGRHDLFCEQGSDKMYFPIERDIFSFTGLGEIAVEKIYEAFFAKMGLKVAAVDANSFSIEIFGENPQETLEKEPKIVDKVRDTIKSRVKELLAENDGAVSSGRLPGAAESRGYSDVAAELFAEILNDAGYEALLYIAKQDPIRSADPTKVENTRVVGTLTTDLAIELFGPNGADAGALHPDAAKRLGNIKVVVGNPSKPENGHSLISREFKPQQNGVEIVAKKNMAAVLEISSPDMADRNGVVKTIADHLDELSIGHFFTEESSITITFNDDITQEKADEIKQLLESTFQTKYEVKLRKKLSLIFCLSNKMNILKESVRAGEVLVKEGISVEHYQGGRSMVIKYLVPTSQADQAVKALHEKLICKT